MAIVHQSFECVDNSPGAVPSINNTVIHPGGAFFHYNEVTCNGRILSCTVHTR